MRILFPILILLGMVAAASAQSTNRITAKITVTTATSNNFAFTLNGNTRVFTNSVTAAASQITTNHTVAGSASNFYYHVVATPFTGPVVPLNYTNGSNVIFLRGALGQAMSVTILSNWATVEYSTQVFSSGLIEVRVPMASVTSAERVKVASELVTGINAYTTNAFATNSPALTNHLSLGPQPQMAANKVFNTSHLTGSAVSNSYLTNITRANVGALRATNVILHNGFATNTALVNSPSANITNLTGYGGFLSNIIGHSFTITNLSSPGSAVGSQQFGENANASGLNSFAVGVDSVASSNYAAAFGYLAAATEEGALAVGEEAEATGYGGTALGGSSIASAYLSTAVGALSSASYSNSAAFGASAASTTTNQIRLGTSSEHISIPGEVRDVKLTNVWNTGTNRFDLAVAFTRTNITTLANGVNLVDPGLKTYLKVSGPSAGYSIDKLQRGWDGRRILIQKNDAFTLTIANESGSGGGTDADRILTGTGGNVTITNAPGFVELIYDSAASRWGVISKSN